MSTYTQNIYHIVFATKYRQPSLAATDEQRKEFLEYAAGTVRGLDCFLYRINSVDDHLHVLVDIHPSLALATFIKEFKQSTGKWLRLSPAFRQFTYWQEGYAGFTVSWQDRHRLIAYINNQQEHHKKVTFIEELKMLLAEAGLEFDERYLP